MNNHQGLALNEYDYPLPDERIARFPEPNRSDSKLLVYNQGNISDSAFTQLPDLTPSDALLIFNNTRVVHSRFFFETELGHPIEIFCLEPAENLDTSLAMKQEGFAKWNCLIGGARKWRTGVLEKSLRVNDTELKLTTIKGKNHGDYFEVDFSWLPAELSFAEVMQLMAELPLPPYLNRKPEQMDEERYQTVYAQLRGSVAAPTAGLHFTPEILSALNQKGVQTEYLTLHVGAGTFKPVKTDNPTQHEMHREYFEISKHLILKLIQYADNKIIPVGTTSMRSLESLYWLGVKCKQQGFSMGQLPLLGQWDAYGNQSNVSFKESFQSLINYMDENHQSVFKAQTQIMIMPGYQFRVCSGLITNFHQPKSTLLMLVSAFVGADWKIIYRHALQNDYRFLSYGDSSLLLPKEILIK